MRAITTTLLLFILTMPAMGQWDAHMLYESKHYLNGGLNATMQGGKSRLSIPLYVPAGYRYIIIRTTIHATERLDRYNMAQAALSIMATGGLSTISALETGLNTTTGYGMLDMRVYNHPKCKDLFISKAPQECRAAHALDNWSGGVSYFPIAPNSGTFYLCYRNPETLDGVPFYVEAMAVKEIESAPAVQQETAVPDRPEQARQSYQFDKDKYKKQKVDTRLLQYSKEPAKAMEE